MQLTMVVLKEIQHGLVMDFVMMVHGALYYNVMNMVMIVVTVEL